jgi:hypothetical protein
MENQHRKITGYRELTQDEIDRMNEAKALAEQCGKLIEGLRIDNANTGNHLIDLRWLAIAETHLQQGFMAMVRSIAKPMTF